LVEKRTRKRRRVVVCFFSSLLSLLLSFFSSLLCQPLGHEPLTVKGDGYRLTHPSLFLFYTVHNKVLSYLKRVCFLVSCLLFSSPPPSPHQHPKGVGLTGIGKDCPPPDAQIGCYSDFLGAGNGEGIGGRELAARKGVDAWRVSGIWGKTGVFEKACQLSPKTGPGKNYFENSFSNLISNLEARLVKKGQTWVDRSAPSVV